MIKKLLCAMCLAACLLLSACVATGQDVEVPELIRPVVATFDTTVIQRGTLISVVQRTGVTRYVSQPLYFSNPIAAFDSFHISPGDHVVAGQLLATLVTTQLEEELETQHDTLATMRTNQNTAIEIRLLEIDIAVLEHAARVAHAAEAQLSQEAAEAIERQNLNIERMHLELAQQRERDAVQLRQVQNRIEELNRRIAQARLYAPFDGRITNISTLTRGQGIAAAQAILYITDQQQVIVDAVDLPATDWPSGMDSPPDPWRPNLLRHTRYWHATIDGQTYEIEYIPVALEERPARPVRFNIVGEHNVAAGQYASLTFYSHRMYDVILVPDNAIFMSNDGPYVYRVIDGDLIYTQVRFYGRTQIAAAVSLGLEEGDVVFVRP